MIVRIYNPDLTKNVTTFLTQTASSGGTTLNVKNTAGYVQSQYIVVGNVGDEKSEIVQISAAVSSNTQLTVTALKFDHSTDTIVMYTKYNKVRVYRSTDGGTVYTILSTPDMQVDRFITTYDDVNSQPTYFYKSTFYNSSDGTESSFSSVLPATGFTWYSLITLQNRVYDLFPDKNEEVISRPQITDWANEEYRKLVSLASKIDQGIFLKSNSSSPSSLTSGTALYSLPTDFKSMKKLEIAFDGTNYYRGYPQQEGFGYPTMVYDKTAPLYIMISNQIEIRPTPDSSSGKYRLWYYYIPDPLSADSDTIDLALRPYLDAVVSHVLARGKQKDKKYDEAAYWDQEAEKVETLMVNELQNRTTLDIPRFVDITDSSFLDSDETYLWDC